MNHKKKIMIVVPSFKRLGPEIVMEDLANGLGDKVQFVFVSLRKNDPKDLSRYKKYTTYEVGMGGVPTRKIKKKLNNIIENEKPDVLHTNCFWPSVLLRKNKCKKITTVHNNPKVDFSFEYGGILGKMMARVYKRSLRGYDKVICISNYVQNTLELDASKTEVIYNSVEDLQDVESVKIDGFDDKCINLYTVSVLTPRKNVMRMLDIVSMLKSEGVRVKLYIVGDGRERNKIAREIRVRKLDHEICLLGQRSKEYIKGLAQVCDCFLFTSIDEGFGLVIAEALRDGKYVCTSNFEAAQEVLEGVSDAKICDTDEEYVEYIEKIWNIKKRLKLKKMYSKHNRDSFGKRYTNAKMCSRYKEVYNKIAKKNVLHYIPFYDVGGIESLINNFMVRERGRYNFTILVEHSLTDVALSNLSRTGATVVELPNFKSVHFVKYIKALRDVFKNVQADIFHSHDYSLRILPMKFAKKASVAKRIAHVHSSSLEGTKHIELKKKLINCGMRWATDIIYCSDDAKKFVGIERGQIIYNGIEDSAFCFDGKKRKIMRRSLGYSDDDVVIIQIGRMVPVKNFNFTLELIKKMPLRYKLLLVGDGPLRNQLEENVDADNLYNRVNFVGCISNVNDFLCAADVMVQPSSFEGFGITMLEGISSGLTCLASSAPAVILNRDEVTQLQLNVDGWRNFILEHNFERKTDVDLSEFSLEKFCVKLQEVYNE